MYITIKCLYRRHLTAISRDATKPLLELYSWKLYENFILKKTAGKNASLWGKKPWKLQGHEKVWNVFLTGYSKSKHFEDFARQHPLYLCLYVCTYVLILFYILNLSRWNRSSWIHVLKQCHSNFNTNWTSGDRSVYRS